MTLPVWLKQPPSQKPRIHLLDEVRGFAVFCMVFYHGFYTFSTIFHLSWCTALLRFFAPAEPVFAGLFLFLSGIASNLSRSNLRRGLILGGISVLISVVLFFAAPEEMIWFGILHLLSFCMILTGLLLPALNRIPVLPGMAVCFALVALTYPIEQGALGFFGISIWRLPAVLYQTDWLMLFGIHSGTFYSSDYFPILPWLFVFLGGVFFGRYARAGRFPQWSYRKHVPFFSFLGRHALVIYLVHQPVFYGIGLLFAAGQGAGSGIPTL